MIQNSGYLIAAFLFVLGIKKLSSPATARQGNLISALGMLIAVIVTLIHHNIISYQELMIGLGIGTVIGVISARLIAMTAMPEMVALLNGCGGGSSLLLALAAYIESPFLTLTSAIISIISILIGGVTFTGSIVAWGKLSGTFGGKPLRFIGSQFINIICLIVIVWCGYMFVSDPMANAMMVYGVIAGSLVLGIMSVMSIGGGDMPVVIALLNSYSGIAASGAGFVIGNVLLIVAGLLVGASGLILTNIMCKAMNRSLTNVLFGGFGVIKSSDKDKEQGEVNPISAQDAYLVLEAARSVVIVPGYGMAVAQAQHATHELAEFLEENGCEVKYAIHPVAGRMPGHMNVLLAEASVPYEQLHEMDDINPDLGMVDVCVVIGANDVVNPDAIEDEASPIYGMPIIEVTKARSVFVLKRSMNPGFAGIQNPLFFKENTRMLFGDAKESLHHIVTEFKE